MNRNDGLLTESQAADFLKLAPSTLRKLRCTRGEGSALPNIPYIRLGAEIRYLRADLDAVVNEARVNGEGAA